METEKYEDLLLSITEPIDKERRKPIKSDIETKKLDAQINPVSDLSAEKEEKEFYQKMISLFTPEKQIKQTRIDRTDYLDLIDKKYIIRRPLKEANWAIYEDKTFLVRIRMIKKNEYLFKVYNHTFSCLNLSPEMSELIRGKIEPSEKYCQFMLDYQNAVLILDDFYNISKRIRNTLLSESLLKKNEDNNDENNMHLNNVLVKQEAKEKETKSISSNVVIENDHTQSLIKDSDNINANISLLGLSSEIVNSLYAAGIKTKRELDALDWDDLEKIPGIDMVSQIEIMSKKLVYKKENSLMKDVANNENKTFSEKSDAQ